MATEKKASWLKKTVKKASDKFKSFNDNMNKKINNAGYKPYDSLSTPGVAGTTAAATAAKPAVRSVAGFRNPTFASKSLLNSDVVVPNEASNYFKGIANYNSKNEAAWLKEMTSKFGDTKQSVDSSNKLANQKIADSFKSFKKSADGSKRNLSQMQEKINKILSDGKAAKSNPYVSPLTPALASPALAAASIGGAAALGAGAIGYNRYKLGQELDAQEKSDDDLYKMTKKLLDIAKRLPDGPKKERLLQQARRNVN